MPVSFQRRFTHTSRSPILRKHTPDTTPEKKRTKRMTPPPTHQIKAALKGKAQVVLLGTSHNSVIMRLAAACLGCCMCSNSPANRRAPRSTKHKYVYVSLCLTFGRLPIDSNSRPPPGAPLQFFFLFFNCSTNCSTFKNLL